MLGIITPAVQENITAVAKVTLHVWTCDWGQRPATDAKAQNKRGGARAHRRKVGLPPPQFWGPGVLPPGNL